MKTVVVTDPPRADADDAAALGSFGVATVIARTGVRQAMAAAQARVAREAVNRAAFERGELGLDRYGLRDRLREFGIRHVSFDEYQRETG